MSRVNQALVNKWLEALRSGTFKQGKYSLCSERGGDQTQTYCCLGVLAEVCGFEKIKTDYDENFRYKFPNGEEGIASLRNADILPEGSGAFSVARLSVDGIAFAASLMQKCTLRDGDVIQLSALNDRGATFEEIAKMIEFIQESDAWESNL